MLRKTLCSFLAFWIIFSPFANTLMKTAEAAPTVGAPTFSPGALAAGVPTEVVVSARILKGPTDPAIVSAGVNLLRVDTNGAVLGIVGTMKDDGTGGDPTGNDRTFTLRFTVTASAGETIRLRASVPFRGWAQRVLSPIATIPVQIAQNLPPHFTSAAPTAGAVGVAYNYQATAQDPENSALTFQLVSGPNGMTLNQAIGLVQWTPAANQTGPQSVSLGVLDGAGASALQNFTIQVAAPQNLPPAFTSVAPSAATVGTLYSYQATAQDPENGALAYQVVSGPSGLTIGPTTGLVQWTPGSGDVGPQIVQLRVSDPQNASATQSFTIQVNPAGTNLPPVITSTPITTATTTVTYTYQVAAQDPEGGALTYQLASGPSGLTIGATGFVQWIPTTTQPGDQSVQLRVIDAQGASTPQNFTVRVSELNLAPIITSVPTTFAKTTEPYKYDVSAYDPEKRAVAFSFAQAQAAGMTIDAATGAVRWNPTNGQIGNVTVSVRATDPVGAFDTQTFSVRVFDPANDLQITSPNGPQTIRIGQTLTLPLQANYSGALFSINPSLTNGSITGSNFTFKPANDQEGVQTVTFKAVYGDMQKSVVVPITVTRDNSAPAIAPIGQQTVQEGNTLSFTVSATDAENDPLTYSAPGLNLTNAFFSTFARQFTFNPVVGQAGNYQVVFEVSDGRSASQITVPIRVTAGSGNQQILNLVVDPPTSPTFQTSATITGNVTGQAGIPPPKQNPPLVTGLVPSVAKQGQTLNVQLTGLNTAFAQTTSRADFGDGIKVNSLTVSSPTSAQANITIDSLARLGTRTVRMLTVGSEAPAVVAFSVDKGVASISGLVLDPFTNQRLANARVSINNTTIFGLTDSQGRFTLTNVPVGTVPLVITLPNYDVQRVTVAVGANETVNLEAPIKVNALARPPTFVGSLPRAATVASVLDRGVTAKGGGLTLDQAKAVIQDTMIAVGGIEAGVFDSAGNQLNPQVSGAGDFSLTTEGVENHARGLLRGDVVTLKDFVNVLTTAFAFPAGLSLSTVVDGFQRAANEAWKNPSDPESAMALVLFNESTSLSAQPPIITPDTRFNSVQVFLLTASFLVYSRPALEASIDSILRAGGVNAEAILPPPRFSRTVVPVHNQFAWNRVLPNIYSGIKGWLVADAHAAEAGVPGCPPGVFPCTYSDLRKRVTFSKVYRTIGANAVGEAVKGGFASLAIAAATLAASQALMAFLLGPLAPGLVLGVVIANFALAFTAGFVGVLMFKLVLGWYIAETAASLEPSPISDRGSSFDSSGSFVIKFDISAEHRISATNPTKIPRKYAYHLYRLPNCSAEVDASTAEYLPVKTTVDFTDALNQHDATKPYIGRHMFVVPPALLKTGQNCFRIRTFQYIAMFQKDLVEGIEVYDSNNDSGLSLDEFRNAGFGDALTMGRFDRNGDNKLDANEFNEFQQVKGPPKELQISSGVPKSSELQRFMGDPRLNPATYAGKLQTAAVNLKNDVALRLNNLDSSTYRFRNFIVGLAEKSPAVNLNTAVPKLQEFVNNIGAFKYVDEIHSAVTAPLPQTTAEDDVRFAQQATDTAAQRHLGRPATQPEIDAAKEILIAQRKYNATSDSMDFHLNEIRRFEHITSDMNNGKLSGTFTIEVNNPSIDRATSATILQPQQIEVTPANRDQVLNFLASEKTRMTRTFSSLAGNLHNVVTNVKDTKMPELLKSGLTTTSGLPLAEVENRFAQYFIEIEGGMTNAQASARQAAQEEEGLRALLQNMKQRRASAPPPGSPQSPIDPHIVSLQKGVGATLNFGGQAIGASSALLTFLQSIQVLSSDFSPACFTTGGSPLPSITGFPPTFEPLPAADDPHAVLVGRIDPNSTNPRIPNGLLAREYPGDDIEVSSVEAGFPPGFISVDAQGWVYAVNLNSTEQFGGRIFRYKLGSGTLSSNGLRSLTLTKRELAGTINYYSRDVQIAHPALPVAMAAGPRYQTTTDAGASVFTQDLFLADTEIVANQKRIIKVPVSLIDTRPTTFTDPSGNELLRHRIVGQTILVNDGFRLTGPSDMEVGPDLSSLVPTKTENSVIMLSDEDAIWAIVRDPASGSYSAFKIVQVLGRRWSGLAFDALGKFYFADYAGKEIFCMTFSQLQFAASISRTQGLPYIADEAFLRSNTSRIATLDLAPGDIEIENLSTHPGGVLHVSTDKGILPIDLPITGQLLSDVREVRIKRIAKEESVAIETVNGVRRFRAIPSHEDLDSLKATLSVRRVDANGQEYWQERILFLSAHGATVLETPL